MKKAVTSKDLVVLFYRLLRDMFDLPPGEYHQANMGRDCVYMKQNVVTFFVERGFTMDDVERFVRWFFSTYLPRQKNIRSTPHMGWLPGCLVGYIAEVSPKQSKTMTDSRDVRYRELVYRNDLEFFGVGYRNSEEDFTKQEYWVGHSWRLSHYSKEQMVEYRTRQATVLIDRLGEIEAGTHLFRFRQWEREYSADLDERGAKEMDEYMREVFVRVQAKRRGWPEDRVRQHYGFTD